MKSGPEIQQDTHENAKFIYVFDRVEYIPSMEWTKMVTDVKTQAVKAPAQTVNIAKPASADKKPRAKPIKYADISKVEGMVRSGKGTVDEIVASGVEKRTAMLAIRKLKSEGVIKMSFVIANNGIN
jgi:hypothetical protein